MFKKFLLLCAFLFCYNATFAQHMEFDGVSFDNSLETIHTELVKRGLSLVKHEYDEYSGGELFYNDTYSNMKLSVFVSYTPHSKKVYYISILYNEMYHNKFKEYIENKYNVEPVDEVTRYRIARYHSNYLDYVYNISNIGMIILSNSYNGSIKIIDNEYHYLYKAEANYPKFVKKRDLRKWQKKYNNPLFYDNNPVVKQVKN